MERLQRIFLGGGGMGELRLYEGEIGLYLSDVGLYLGDVGL